MFASLFANPFSAITQTYENALHSQKTAENVKGAVKMKAFETTEVIRHACTFARDGCIGIGVFERFGAEGENAAVVWTQNV